MRKVKKIALSGILSALAVTLMAAGSLSEYLDAPSAVLASFAVAITVIEVGGYFPALVYLSVSALSLLLIPNKFGVVMFLCFFGYYPIVKLKMDTSRLSKRFMGILRILFFAGCAVVVTILAALLFTSSMPKLDNYGYYGIFALLLTFTFFIYDKLLFLFLIRYRSSWQKIIKKFL